MNIAILGGAFDPPHKDHLSVAEHVLRFGGIDEVWLLPNYGHKYYGIAQHKKTAPAADRLAMTRLLETDRIKVSTIEIDHKTSGQTIELLPLLPKEHTYTFIIGSDQLPRFNEWHGYKQLLQRMRFLVIPRVDYPIEKEKLYPGMEVVGHAEVLRTRNISSTKIRELIAANLPISDFVDSRVERYIYHHGLYKEGVGLRKEGLRKQR